MRILYPIVPDASGEFKGKLGMCFNVRILYSKEWYAYKPTNQSPIKVLGVDFR